MNKLLMVILAVFMLNISPVFAQSSHPGVCEIRVDMIDTLRTKYDEEIIGRGVTNGTTIIELLTSAENGTWTIIESYPDGMSCLRAAGSYWQELKTNSDEKL